MRKILTFIIIFAINFSVLSINSEAKDSLKAISADGIVLMDYTTGQILYSKNMDTQYPPASTTKIMTALLALEKCSLDDIVTVGKNPPFAEGSKIYLLEDEKLTVKDLLYALILQSANDAAEALAEHISGSTEEFTKLMNTRAVELGATNTNFVNAHGLYDEKHRTTAKDLAIILRELYKHEEFKEIATESMHYIEPTNKSDKKRPLWNKNNLVQKNSKYYYEGCEGGKTGYTVQSKHSYVAVASRNGQKLVAVLLHDSKHTYWSDIKVLLDYGFENFTTKPLYLEGDFIGNYTVKENTQIPLLAAEDFYYVKNSDSTSVPKLDIVNKDISDLSFNRGDTILTGNISLDDKNIGTLKISSGEDYSSKKFISSLGNSSKKIFIILIKIILYIFVLFALFIIFSIIKKKKRLKKKKYNKYIHTNYYDKYKDEK